MWTRVAQCDAIENGYSTRAETACRFRRSYADWSAWRDLLERLTMPKQGAYTPLALEEFVCDSCRCPARQNTHPSLKTPLVIRLSSPSL